MAQGACQAVALAAQLRLAAHMALINDRLDQWLGQKRIGDGAFQARAVAAVRSLPLRQQAAVACQYTSLCEVLFVCDQLQAFLRRGGILKDPGCFQGVAP